MLYELRTLVRGAGTRAANGRGTKGGRRIVAAPQRHRGQAGKRFEILAQHG